MSPASVVRAKKASQRYRRAYRCRDRVLVRTNILVACTLYRTKQTRTIDPRKQRKESRVVVCCPAPLNRFRGKRSLVETAADELVVGASRVEYRAEQRQHNDDSGGVVVLVRWTSPYHKGARPRERVFRQKKETYKGNRTKEGRNV